jgi:predicted O-methyltransferase YrrM
MDLRRAVARVRAEAQLRLATRKRTAARLEQIEARLETLTERIDQHSRSLGDLHARPLDALVPTMAWIEQATLSTSPLVSTVLPTHNRAGRLRRAVESVLAQTYERWELLIVDDGSEDETPAVVASFDDPRVRGTRIDHGGVCAARNAALELAAGDLVAYLDDDNTMHPGWLKSAVWAFEQRPSVEVLYGALVIDDLARTRRRSSGELPSIYLNPYDRAALADWNLADTSAIVHRAGLSEARFDESLQLMSDWDLLARLTTDRDPLVLPAIACFYSTDAPDRISGGPSEAADVELVRRRVRAARGLVQQEPGAWALGPEALELVLERIPLNGAAVVECGSGESTIAIGRLLRSRGSGRLQALEHHRGWAAEVRRRVEAEGLGEQVEVIDAPLGPHELAPAGCQWYAAEALDRLAPRIDVLLVDGPPASEEHQLRARYPALPALADRLAPGATVILDDIGRPGERWILDRWEAEHEIGFERRDEQGIAIGVC